MILEGGVCDFCLFFSLHRALMGAYSVVLGQCWSGFALVLDLVFADVVGRCRRVCVPSSILLLKGFVLIAEARFLFHSSQRCLNL